MVLLKSLTQCGHFGADHHYWAKKKEGNHVASAKIGAPKNTEE